MLSLTSAFRATLDLSARPFLACGVGVPIGLTRAYYVGSNSYLENKQAGVARTRFAGKPRLSSQEGGPLLPWELLGPDGEKVPLPMETRPRYSSSYLMYLTSRQAAIRNDPRYMTRSRTSSNKMVHDIKRINAEALTQWKEMSEAEREPYVEQYRQARAQFVVEYTKWRDALTAQDRKRQRIYNEYMRKHGMKPSPACPPVHYDTPRATSGYHLFRLQGFEKRPGELLPSIQKRLSKAWFALSEEERQRWRDLHAQQREEEQKAKEEAEANA